jgi:hypothetical protein
MSIDKQQAAEEKFPLGGATVLTAAKIKQRRKDFIAGWEAHEAQCSKWVEKTCTTCNGDGFIKSAVRQSDGTYQVDCTVCNAQGKLYESVSSVTIDYKDTIRKMMKQTSDEMITHLPALGMTDRAKA